MAERVSRERELLKRVISGDDDGDFFISHRLYKDIETFLDQPEQEPEAWIIVNKETGYRTQVSELTPFLYHREIFEVIPLYTAPPVKSEQDNIQYLLDQVARLTAENAMLKGKWSTQKREPIEDGELEVWYSQHTWAMDKQEYMWGFRDAEQAHGIGGE